MEKKGKIAWFGVIVIVVGIAIFDLWLDGDPEQMTISQMALDAGQRNPLIIVIVGVLFIWLFGHLFWRWKNVWSWIKDRL